MHHDVRVDERDDWGAGRLYAAVSRERRSARAIRQLDDFVRTLRGDCASCIVAGITDDYELPAIARQRTGGERADAECQIAGGIVNRNDDAQSRRLCVRKRTRGIPFEIPQVTVR